MRSKDLLQHYDCPEKATWETLPYGDRGLQTKRFPMHKLFGSKKSDSHSFVVLQGSVTGRGASRDPDIWAQADVPLEDRARVPGHQVLKRLRRNLGRPRLAAHDLQLPPKATKSSMSIAIQHSSQQWRCFLCFKLFFELNLSRQVNFIRIPKISSASGHYVTYT